MDLPVLAAADELRDALADPGAAVLVAPPGTGKTTAVPLLLADWLTGTGRVVVLEPRRLAARAAAARMAGQLGERVGDTVGYSVRGDRRVSRSTRIEVVTEGLFLRRLQSDPELSGVAAVLLDEFHERSVDSDLTLALLLDVRASLRDDLRLVAMSATLDPAPVAGLLSGSATEPAPVVVVDAPLHPVELRHRPGSVHDPLERRVGDAVREALAGDEGDVLVFLPGRAEIRRTAAGLRGSVPAGVEVLELHGGLSPAEQDRVVGGHRHGVRRVVLSTSLAETSITVPGVRIVVDAGRRRTQQVDPRSGLPRLVTTAASRASADQRAGRAGREAPGVAIRLWARSDERHRPDADPPGILEGDLAALALQVRAWGAGDPGELRWLDPPPAAAMDAASALLVELGALDDAGTLTARGRRLAQIGFHPRLAAIALDAADRGDAELGADLLAVLEAGRPSGTDLAERVRALRAGGADGELRTARRQWRATLEVTPRDTDARRDDDLERRVAALALAGFPDRVARRRDADRTDGTGRAVRVFQLRGGGEAAVRGDDPLGRAPWLVVTDLDAGGAARTGRVHLAAAVEEAVVRDRLAERIDRHDRVVLEGAHGEVRVRTDERLGAIELGAVATRTAPADVAASTLLEAVRAEGLHLLDVDPGEVQLRARVACLRGRGVPGPDAWPDWSDEALRSSLEAWLAPALRGVGSRAALATVSLEGTLSWQLDHVQRRRLDELAPTSWTTATGRTVRLRYGALDGRADSVLARARLADLLGTDEHPVVAGGIPVTVEVLSPAGRPLQRTADLPGFWRGSYAAVRAELRGRYPKHPWPERPWERPG